MIASLMWRDRIVECGPVDADTPAGTSKGHHSAMNRRSPAKYCSRFVRKSPPVEKRRHAISAAHIFSRPVEKRTPDRDYGYTDPMITTPSAR